MGIKVRFFFKRIGGLKNGFKIQDLEFVGPKQSAGTNLSFCSVSLLVCYFFQLKESDRTDRGKRLDMVKKLYPREKLPSKQRALKVSLFGNIVLF